MPGLEINDYPFLLTWFIQDLFILNQNRGHLRSRDDKMSHHAVTTNQKVGDNGDAPAGATKEHPRMSKATKTIDHKE
jgi:hypothetical protein